MPEPIMLPATSAVAPKRPMELWRPAAAGSAACATVISDAAMASPRGRRLAPIFAFGGFSGPRPAPASAKDHPD